MLRQFLYTGFNLGSIVSVLVRLVVVLLAICVHEMAHGFAAYKLGDPTAKFDGRLSLNPLRHIDPLGAICMFFFGFGWAKPVSVNPNYFKNYKRDMRITALAGPVSNFLMAYIGMLLFVHVAPLVQSYYFSNFVVSLVMMNIGLGVFNLLPIPPLDGSKVFLSLLPAKMYYEIMRFERYGFLVLAVALYLGVLDPILSICNTGVVRALLFLAGGSF